MKPLLLLILGIATVGLAFSGYLAYRELFSSSPGLCTPVGQAGTFLEAPPCVFGFFMYLAIVVAAVLGFALGRRREEG